VSKRTKKAIVIGALAATLAVGVGAAVADGGLGFGNDQQAFLNDVAKRLNVTPAELKAALQGAYGDQIDAAVAAGKITKEQADAMKARTKEGGLPFFGGGHRDGFDHHGPLSLDAAATYLDLTPAALRTALESGKTLAQVAEAQKKSVDGLKKALAAETKTKLDAAVKDGRLTQAQADALQTRMTEHLDDLVNGVGGPHGHHEGSEGFGGPPPDGWQPPASSGGIPVAPTGSPI
jgi:hypothetical protein